MQPERQSWGEYFCSFVPTKETTSKVASVVLLLGAVISEGSSFALTTKDDSEANPRGLTDVMISTTAAFTVVGAGWIVVQKLLTRARINAARDASFAPLVLNAYDPVGEREAGADRRRDAVSYSALGDLQHSGTALTRAELPRLNIKLGIPFGVILLGVGVGAGLAFIFDGNNSLPIGEANDRAWSLIKDGGRIATMVVGFIGPTGIRFYGYHQAQRVLKTQLANLRVAVRPAYSTDSSATTVGSHVQPGVSASGAATYPRAAGIGNQAREQRLSSAALLCREVREASSARPVPPPPPASRAAQDTEPGASSLGRSLGEGGGSFNPYGGAGSADGAGVASERKRQYSLNR